MNKEFLTVDGQYIVTRVSRWISIKHKYDIRKNNTLYDYCTDGYGYHPYDNKFNPQDGTSLDYFTFNKRKYAVEQFLLLSGAWICEKPYAFIDTDGKSTFITAFDGDGNIFDPWYAEFDEYCEHVRLYTVKSIKH